MTYSELKSFWKQVRPVDPATKHPVDHYVIKSRKWPGRPGVMERWVEAVCVDPQTNSKYHKFFLYLEDAYHNARILQRNQGGLK